MTPQAKSRLLARWTRILCWAVRNPTLGAAFIHYGLWLPRLYLRWWARRKPDQRGELLFYLTFTFVFDSAARWRQWLRILKQTDALPTVQRGKAAIGMTSLAEWNQFIVRENLPGAVPNFARRPSPYTHPLQIPSIYIPGVPAQMFYNAHDLPWAAQLEAATPIIRAELEALLAQDAQAHNPNGGFQPYVGLTGKTHTYWNTYILFLNGQKHEANCARCPQTVRILESLPRLDKGHIIFSAINPRAHLYEHTGPLNGLIRAHLPLITPRQPENCTIRVGDQTRHWEYGKLLVFDDSFLHEVHNRTDELRVVLFIDFWHPALTDDEVRTLEQLRLTMYQTKISKEWDKYQLRFQPAQLQGLQTA